MTTATNRLNGSGFTYDSNGNMTGRSTPSGSVTATYDIDNRMTSITTPSVTETYKYGVGNLRAMKYQGGDWTYSVDGAAGELLGTFKGCAVGGIQFLCEARLRVYFGGRLILNGWTGVRPDRLGSPDGPHGRVYPYGEVSGTVSPDQEETYTTYTRDVYTGLDYAKNRSYAYSWGRFTSADPYRASGGPANPGSWNRYAYVENEPVSYVDPRGLQLRAPICYWQNNVGWEAGWYFTGFQSNICEEWGSDIGGGPTHFAPPDIDSGGGAESREECEKRIRTEQNEKMERYDKEVDALILKLAQAMAITFGTYGAISGAWAGGPVGALVGGISGSVVGFITPFGGWGELLKIQAGIRLLYEEGQRIEKECPK